MGVTNVMDDLSISLSNSNPSQGNGWFFMLPPDLSGQVFEYYKTIAGVRVAFDLNVMGQSVKSSFQLWWEHWGVVVQIVASIVLSFFTGGLSLGIQGLFRSGVLASPRILTWLTAQGGFNVARSKILAFFILESAVNLPSAWIDYSFDNEYNDEKRMDMIVQQICENDIKEKFEKNFEVINEKHLHNRKMFLELKERLLKNYEKSLLC
jgi:hypothetical protein